LDDLNEFRKELHRLEGKQTEESGIAASQEWPKGIFDDILEMERYRDPYAEELARVAAINEVEKACPSCFRRQPREHDTCVVCGETPEVWLLSAPLPLHIDGQHNVVDDAGNVIATGRSVGIMKEAGFDDNWRRWAATSATVDELKYIVSRFSAPSDGWKVKHAACILKLVGENVPPDFYGGAVDVGFPTPETQATDSSITVTRRQVAAADEFYAAQQLKIQQQLAELRNQIGAEGSA
jgi:hypothetical protein